MNKMILHLNAHCHDCDCLLYADTEHWGYYNSYLKTLIVFCDACQSKREQERIKKVSEEKFSKSARGKLVQKLSEDKSYRRLNEFFG